MPFFWMGKRGLTSGSVFDLEQFTQDAPEGLGGFPDNNVHTKAPFYRLQQARPHAISKNATSSISAPTGKMAAIKIPAPSATAQTPSIQPPPGPPRHIRPAPSPKIAGRPGKPGRASVRGIPPQGNAAFQSPPAIPVYCGGPSMVRNREKTSRQIRCLEVFLNER